MKISDTLNSIRDFFLPRRQVVKLNQTIDQFEKLKVISRISAICFGALAVYSRSYFLLLPAYLTFEANTFFCNAQEICEQVDITMATAKNLKECEKQLFKNAPLFHAINRIVDPYFKTVVQAQKYIQQAIRDAIQNKA